MPPANPVLTQLSPSQSLDHPPTAAQATTPRATTSPKRLARIAGVLYLLNGIFSGFAYYVDRKVYASGNAATTAANVLAHSGLVRFAVVSDLLQATIFVFLGMTLHLLLRHARATAANAMVVFVAIAAGVMCLNAVFEFEGLRVATGAIDPTALGTAGTHAIVLLLLDTQHFGFLIAQIFFGLWLVPLGYLATKSGWFPKPLGVLLILGGACYLVGTLAAFLAPGGQQINTTVTIPSAIAEISMVGYLLLAGISARNPGQLRTAGVAPAA
jgi:hypothetical protein